jgi:Icc-related predicted phosphoesterase
MTKTVKYGIMQDIHYYPQIVPQAIEVLKSLGANRLILNGDLVNAQNTVEMGHKVLAFILGSAVKSGLETIVQPGSHEMLPVYDPVIEAFADKYDSIIDCRRIRKFSEDGEGHELVFLPGSDSVSIGNYILTNSPELPTAGIIKVTKMGSLALPYTRDEHKFIAEERYETFDKYAEGVQKLRTIASLDPKAILSIFRHFRIDDVKKYVTTPEKTIVVCHVPRKFDNLETAVDFTTFGIVSSDFVHNSELTRKGTIVPMEYIQDFMKVGCPIEIRKENRGNVALKEIFEQTGVVKAISGHFHESSHRANNSKGEHVNEGEFVNELFWNAGHFDSGAIGLLTVDGEKAAYMNVRISDFVK